MTDTMTTTAPERIWLQIDPSGDPNDRSEPCPDPADVELTWCWSQVGGQEVEYVRADLIGGTTGVPASQSVELDPYDAGLLGGHDDCSVDWWHDYIRSELDTAHVFYQQQVSDLPSPAPPVADHWAARSPGLADQFRAEAQSVRKHLGFAPDANDVAPIDLRKAIDRRAAQAAVPEGWKLVPVEPTAEMLELAVPAGMSLEDAGPEENEERRRIAERMAQLRRMQVARTYKTMLAAAPAAPAQPDIMDEPTQPGDFEAMQRGHEADLYDDVTSEQVGNLVALVRRLAYALRKVTPDSDLSAWATGYLNRIGFADSPLSAAQQPVSDEAWHDYIRSELAEAPAQQPVSDPDGSDDRVLMPRHLTAENGAKGAMMGEFSFSARDQLQGVPWTVIKEIYAAAVDLLGKPAPDEREIAAQPLDVDAEYKAFCQWCRDARIDVDYRLHTCSGRSVSGGAYIRDEDARLMFRAWRERAKRAAPLVSAAPDLLEELEEAAGLLHCGCNHPACRQCVRDKRWQETIDRAIGHNMPGGGLSMGRKIGFRYRCRHTRCRARRTLPRLVEQYVREPRCKACGGPLTLDHYRNTKELASNKVCHCDEYPFPHRRGGGVFCIHHPEGPSDRDLRERYGQNCLDVPLEAAE